MSRDPLETLAPALSWNPDWPDVLRRARVRGRFDARTKRRLVLALALATAVAAPFVAYGAASDWWFLGSGASPTPVNAPAVVREGEWSGHSWKLVAYRSSTDGLCLALTPKGSEAAGEGAAMGCGPIAGVPRTAETKAAPDMTITYLVASRSNDFPSYIVGPVVDTADEVEIRFATGRTIRVPTFAGPSSLGHVRFYAAELPAAAGVPKPGKRPFVDKLSGSDRRGNLVACLVPATARNGISALSDCR